MFILHKHIFIKIFAMCFRVVFIKIKRERIFCLVEILQNINCIYLERYNYEYLSILNINLYSFYVFHGNDFFDELNQILLQLSLQNEYQFQKI